MAAHRDETVTASRPPAPPRAKECARVGVDGQRLDGGSTCTVLLVRYASEGWVLYPHGMAGLAVRLTDTAARKLAAAVLAG